MQLNDALKAARTEYENAHGPIGEPDQDAEAQLYMIRRAFEAGAHFGELYGTRKLDAAFDLYMLAELTSALESRGVDVSEIDRAVVGALV